MNEDIFKKYDITLPSIEDADKNDNPPIIALFTNGDWNWYIIGGEKLENGDYLLYGLVKGIYNEIGTFTLSQIEEVSAKFTPNFDNIGLYDIYK